MDKAGLAQSVEEWNADRDVAGSIPGARQILRVLKWLRNEGTAFIPGLQTAGPSSCFYASLRIFVISDLAITLTDFHAV